MRFDALKEKNATEKFMDEFYEKSMIHPFKNKYSLIGDIKLSISPFKEKIFIHNIRNDVTPRTGEATKVMEFLKSLSKKYKVPLVAFVNAQPSNEKHIQNDDDLLKWYKKLDFKVCGSHNNKFIVEYDPT